MRLLVSFADVNIVIIELIWLSSKNSVGFFVVVVVAINKGWEIKAAAEKAVYLFIGFSLISFASIEF